MFKIRTAKLDQTNVRGTSQAINRDVGNFLDPLLEGVCDMGNHLDGLAEVFTLACIFFQRQNWKLRLKKKIERYKNCFCRE